MTRGILGGVMVVAILAPAMAQERPAILPNV